MLHFARSVSSSLVFMNVGLWTGGILVFHLVLLCVPVALFARFRTPGTPAFLQLYCEHFVIFAFRCASY